MLNRTIPIILNLIFTLAACGSGGGDSGGDGGKDGTNNYSDAENAQPPEVILERLSSPEYNALTAE